MTSPLHTDGPKISIIVATFNAARTIGRCIDSISVQTYPNRELIVIDGGSTDGTVEILRKNAARIDQWITEPDSGVYNAWNKGLQRARGEWIGFLGADDVLWGPGALSCLAGEMQKVPSHIRVVYGRVALVSERGRLVEVLGRPWGEIGEQFRSRMSIPHPGTYCRRTLFEERGGFDESFRIAGDYELLLRELKQADAHFADGPILVGMQTGGLSSQSRHVVRALRENDRAHLKHGLSRNHVARGWAYAKAYLRLAASRVLGERLLHPVMNGLRRLRAVLRGTYPGLNR